MSKNVVVSNVKHPFLDIVESPVVEFSKSDYLARLNLLISRLKDNRLDHCIMYGDREHFMNIEYFTGYDPRFEDALLIVSSGGEVTLFVGNEGLGYSMGLTIPVNRVLYQNFSLQGQPREGLCPLADLFKEFNLAENNRVGVVGFKYFETGHEGNPEIQFDLPTYIMNAIYSAVGKNNVVNFTREITGPTGIRTSIYTAKDIAWAESQANRAAAVVQRIIKALRVGISETEASRAGMSTLDPVNVHPMINFGARSVCLGLKSPSDNVTLSVGDPCGVCYSLRGSLCSKIAVASADLEGYGKLKPYFDSFYKQHFKAMCTWYESISVGSRCADSYAAVYDNISHEEHGITLNPGHNVWTEEWLNSSFYKDSPYTIKDGELLQADIIASMDNPVRTSICEDTIAVAGEGLREQLKNEYPETYDRIITRRENIRKLVGINLSDDVLPLSNLVGAYFPFMLDTSKFFAIDAE